MTFPRPKLLYADGATPTLTIRPRPGVPLALAGLAFGQNVDGLHISAAKVGGHYVISFRKGGACHHQRKAPRKVRNQEKILPTLLRAPEGSSGQKKYC